MRKSVSTMALGIEIGKDWTFLFGHVEFEVSIGISYTE
jgi:hypothetical protein